ncbi:MAG: 5'/3'-nucleotidase SurE [Chthonomonadales bacterium]|nr:5'/3'-nucleotidase SurE [Chthonomonadales bacterium]
MNRPRILVTNDDGIHAPGLLALKRALEPIGQVFVVAPERPRSAIGHAVTLHKPLRLRETCLPDGSPAWASSGTPTDCVSLAYEIVMQGRADLACAGINDGANLGWDVTYSGTVMAAMEAAILGVPAIAISVVADGDHPVAHYESAASAAVDIAQRALSNGLRAHTLLNVNVPDGRPERPRAIEVTHQGRREYVDRVVTRQDPRESPYYWLAGNIKDENGQEGSDIEAIRRGAVSVTPLEIDMTAVDLIGEVRAWWGRDRQSPTSTEGR